MEECYYTESNTLLHECSLRFLNYTSDTKSRNVPHIPTELTSYYMFKVSSYFCDKTPSRHLLEQSQQ